MAQILVAEDDRILAETLALELQSRGHQVLTARDGHQALRIAQTKRPDLLALDLMMPRLDGMEVCRRIRGDPQVSRMLILMLTAKTEMGDIVRGFEAGADDYLTKPFYMEEFSLRIQALLRRSMEHREFAEAEGILEVGPIHLAMDTFQVSRAGRECSLTPTEFQLLRYLMNHAGQVCSIDALLEEVWDYPPGTGSPHLVRMHIRNLRRKIEPVPTSPRFICTVKGFGYVLKGDDERMPSSLQPALWPLEESVQDIAQAKEEAGQGVG